MSFEVVIIGFFDRQAKRLIKKYPSLKAEIEQLKIQLAANPGTGVPLGNNCYKIRIAIASKGKGKSGGARIITYVLIADEIVFLLSMYDKSEQQNISDQDLNELLKSL